MYNPQKYFYDNFYGKNFIEGLLKMCKKTMLFEY